MNEDRLCHIVRMATTTARKHEMDRIKRLTVQTRQKLHQFLGEAAFQAVVRRFRHAMARHEE